MKAAEDKILERIARHVRFCEGFKVIGLKNSLCILDLGSGPRIPFYSFLRSRGVGVKKYVALDPRISPDIKEQKNLKLLASPIKERIKFSDDTFDYVVGFAFLEHIDCPKEIMSESLRVLKKGGKIIFTTPTPMSKILLELILTKIGLISGREISEHKNYFDKKSILKILPRKSTKIDQKYFELGLNNLVVVTKINS